MNPPWQPRKLPHGRLNLVRATGGIDRDFSIIAMHRSCGSFLTSSNTTRVRQPETIWRWVRGIMRAFNQARPSCANKRLMHRSNSISISITSSARATNGACRGAGRVVQPGRQDGRDREGAEGGIPICAPGSETSSPAFRFKFGSSGDFGTQMSASGAPSNPAVQFQILSTRLSVTRRHHARVSAMLSKFERYPLTFGPTPIEKLSRLTAHLGGDVEIFAKREDCNSGLAFGGNKLRKLEYIVPDAISSNADTLVSIGGVQSNHTRMVAAVAAKIGMKCRLIQESWVPHEDAVYDRVGNIMLSRIMGAELEMVDEGFDIGIRQSWEDAIADVKAKGGKPYAIPAGASVHKYGGRRGARV